MNNGYHILVYERVKKVTIEETNMYLQEIREDTKDFSTIYKDIIKNYQKNI